jgi:hypothetical protein
MIARILDDVFWIATLAIITGLALTDNLTTGSGDD